MLIHHIACAWHHFACQVDEVSYTRHTTAALPQMGEERLGVLHTKPQESQRGRVTPRWHLHKQTEPPTPPHPATASPGRAARPYLAGAVVEADLVPDHTAQRAAHLLGHPLRHRDGGDAPGLGDTDGPVLRQACGVTENGDTELCRSEAACAQAPVRNI